MNKLPVYMTVSAAFEYLFGEIDTIFRLTWVPVLLGGIGIAALFLLWGNLLGSVPAQYRWAILVAGNFGGFLVTYSAWAVAAAAIHRAILFGDRQPGRFVVCAFGRTERLFLLVPLLLFAASETISLGVGSATDLLASAKITTGAFPPLILLIPSAAVSLAVLYFTLRLSLLYPDIVATGRFRPLRSFAMSRGNSLRLVVVYALGSLFAALVVIAVAIALGLVVGGAASFAVAGLGMTADSAKLLVNAILVLVIGVLGIAIFTSLACHAYKALAGFEPDEILPANFDGTPHLRRGTPHAAAGDAPQTKAIATPAPSAGATTTA